MRHINFAAPAIAALLLASAQGAFLATPAYAATTSVSITGGGSNLQITAGSGKTNNISVILHPVSGGLNFTVTDSDTLSAGPGCSSASAHAVRCPARGARQIVVDAGDKNDKVTVDANLRTYLYGRGGNDTLAGGSGPDAIMGGDGNDRLYGRGGIDSLNGGSGNDRIEGGAGGDNLYGEAGKDGLSGGSGPDTLIGGPGFDALAGGSGNDTCRVAGYWEKRIAALSCEKILPDVSS